MPSNTAPTFVTGDGKVRTQIGVSRYIEEVGWSGRDKAFDAVLQPDGKIVLGGYGNDYPNDGFALVRYTADGTLDKSFGVGGKVLTALSNGRDQAFGVVLQPDGKIVLGGATYKSSGGSNGNVSYSSTLVRYNADGSLDTSFGQGGKAVAAESTGFNSGQSIALQADGKIVLGAYETTGSQTDFVLTRYDANGSRDTSFGSGGKIVTPVEVAGEPGGQSIVLQSDGKIVVGGRVSDSPTRDFSLVRYNADGSLDTSFGSGGTGVTAGVPSHIGQSVALQPDGKLVTVGYKYINSSSYYDFSVVRYNSDGSLDTSFGSDGKVVTPIGSSYDYGYSVAFQSDGKIVVGGYRYSTSTSFDFALVRYTETGQLDPSFGSGGKVVTSLGSLQDTGYSVTIQPDGKILLVGSSYNNRSDGRDDDFAAVRYNADGSLDKTFGTQLNTLSGKPSYTEGRGGVVLDGDVSVYDAELAAQGNYGGASLTIARSGGASTQDVFGSAGVTLGTLVEGGALVVGGVTVGTVETNSGGTLELAFNSNATQARLDSVLHQIAYKNTSNAPPASVALDWTFSDGNAGAQGTGGAKSGTGTKTVAITATNDAPVITSFGGKAATVFVPENTNAVTVFQASDPDNAKLAWSIDGGMERYLFAIDSKTGALSFAFEPFVFGPDAKPDFEAPQDNNRNNIYEVIVKVSDGKLTDSQRLVVKITDVKGIVKNGSDKSNTINGTAEADTLDGRGGNDKLYGLGSNDTVKGGAGDDLISGGKGADKLYGGDGKVGSGNDRFVYTASTDSTLDAAGRDTIYDFASGDRIDLSALDANWNRPDNQAFTFIGTKEYSSVGQLRYELRDGNTYIYADVTGDRRSDFSIQLDDTVRLVKEDFLL